MKNSISYLAALTLSTSLALPLYAQTNANEPPSPAAASSGPATTTGGKEHHPHMHHARHALENAKKALEESQHDYNGHRAKALDAVNTAIQEIDTALSEDQAEVKEHVKKK
jgi:hypothetical protein